MKIAIRLYAQLTAYLPPGETGNPFEITLEEGTTGGDLLAHLGVPQAVASSSILLINGEHGHPWQGLREGDRVSLLPPICGGATFNLIV